MPKYKIKVQFEQETFSFLRSNDEDIISEAKKNGIDYASTMLEGSLDQEDAMGLNDDLREKSFALLCVAYPKPDLNIVIGKEVEDDLYNDQFGKYQK